MQRMNTMKTKTFTFYWYKRTSQDNIHAVNMDIGKVNKTWTMPTEKDVDLYAKYEANRIGAFKYEEYKP